MASQHEGSSDFPTVLEELLMSLHNRYSSIDKALEEQSKGALKFTALVAQIHADMLALHIESLQVARRWLYRKHLPRL